MKVAKFHGFGKPPCGGWPTKTRMVMRLTAFFMFLACMEVQAHGYSQEKLTLSEKDAPLAKVFQAIEKQSDYLFFYDYPMLEKAGKVSVEVKNASLDQVLEICFKDQPFKYEIVGKVVTVKEKEIKVLVNKPPTVKAQGVVYDEASRPLSGVDIFIKGTTKGTVTNSKGEFAISDVPLKALLVVSFIGYSVQEIPAQQDGLIQIHLKVATNQLDETVIKGYYNTTERLNTGNVSTIKGKIIEEQPVSNLLAALEGQVPGMFITQNTGVPGGNFTVQIRGQNSIANGNDPLYVIDGVPYTSELVNNINSVGNGGNPLNLINPADIDRVDVLKDADATAIYGSRGANGVVLITTKKGKANTINLNVSVYSGAGKVTKFMPYMNLRQYLDSRYEALKNDDDSLTDPYLYAPDLLTWDTTRYTNWQKDLIGGTAHYDDAQISFSNGTALTQYLIGGGFHRETTVFPGDNADQNISIHFNLSSITPDKKVRLNLSALYLNNNTSIIPTDLTQSITYLPPDAPPVYNADGSLNWANSTWTNGNPYAPLTANYKGLNNNLVTNGTISYLPITGLEIKTNLGYTNLQTSETSTFPTTYFDPAQNVTSGQSNFNTSYIHSWIIEPQASYQRVIGEGKLNILVGSTFQQNQTQGQLLNAKGFTSNALLSNIQSASSVTPLSSTDAQYKYNALFARLNYNWDEKYLLNVTARRDGSSRFGPGKQFANFGAVGAGWIFSKESLFDNFFHALSFGKLRASYGITGNDQVGDYRYLDLYSSTSSPYAGSQGLYPANLFNPNLSWEVNKKLEGGVELGFLKDKILLTVNYYRNRSSDQLVTYPLSNVTGFTSIAANLPATVQNQGYEFSLHTNNLKSSHFTWTSSINLTIPSNKLVSYPNLSTSPYQNTYIIGKPITIVRLYHSLGVNDTTGIYQFADSKGAPTYNPSFPNDLTSYVSLAPKFYGGFSNSIQYKRLSVDIFFQFVKQTGYNYLFSLITPPGTGGLNYPTYVLNRWQKPGDVTNVEKYNQNYNLFTALDFAQQSDLAYSDASYIRLKNVSIAYQLWNNNSKHQDLKVFVQGQNLWTITRFKGYDPESQSYNSLPPLRVITAGFKINL